MSSSFNTINIKQNEKILKVMTKKWVINLFVLRCYVFSYLEKQSGFRYLIFTHTGLDTEIHI